MIPSFGAALAAAGALCACAPAVPAMVHVDSAEALVAALKAAKAGDGVCLAPGIYAGVGIHALGPATGQVTITACDPKAGARIEGLALYQAQGLVFRGLTLATGPRAAAVRAYDVHRLTLDRVSVEGDPQLAGVQIDGGGEFAFTGSHCTGVSLCVGLAKADGFTISDLMIDGVRSDGIILGEVRNGRILRVTCTNFTPEPQDHADCVQATTARSAAPTENLTIDHLTYLRGPRGGNVQGAFLADEGAKRYRNIRITGSCIVGAIYNGIFLMDADASEIDHNVVIGLPQYWSGIHWWGPVKVHDNLTNQLVGKGAEASNRVAPQAKDQAEGEAACTATRR